MGTSGLPRVFAGLKISTFGERAEDFFYISDKTGDPLEEQQCKELGDLIQKVLAPRRFTGSGTNRKANQAVNVPTPKYS